MQLHKDVVRHCEWCEKEFRTDNVYPTKCCS